MSRTSRCSIPCRRSCSSRTSWARDRTTSSTIGGTRSSWCPTDQHRLGGRVHPGRDTRWVGPPGEASGRLLRQVPTKYRKESRPGAERPTGQGSRASAREHLRVSSHGLELSREVTGGKPAVLFHLQRRVDLRADRLRDWAPCVEPAPGRRIH